MMTSASKVRRSTSLLKYFDISVWLPVGFQAVVYFGALVWLVALSFQQVERLDQPTWIPTLRNYSEVFASAVSIKAFVWAAGLACINTLIALLLAVPTACALTFACPRKLIPIAVFFLFVPFFTNYFVRMIGWQLWLSENGLLGWFGSTVGLERFGVLNTPFAAVIGLQSILIPISTLLLFLTISRIDPTVCAAAKNLGATWWDVFRQLVFRAMRPGLVVAAFSCSMLSIADFVCVRVLAGNQFYTLGSLLADRIKIQDWGATTALSCVILVTGFAMLVLAGLLVNRFSDVRS